MSNILVDMPATCSLSRGTDTDIDRSMGEIWGASLIGA